MKAEYAIRRELKRLKNIKGSGTELISIYVPPNGQISDMTSKLREEYGQAANIKSKSTKTNVQSAIDKITQYLKLYKQAPKNGLAVFCGNTSSVQAKPNIELFSMEPPSPIKTTIYRCDSSFLLDPIESMMEVKELYAMVVMDGRDATVGLLKGSHVTIEKKIHSLAHAKVSKGGQSQNRYQRLVTESIEDYYKRVADSINSLYIKNDFKIKGLIVGGPGPAKEDFVSSKNLNYQIKIMGIFNTGYTDEDEGINELLGRAKEVLQQQSMTQERDLMERFLNEIARNGPAIYGYERVKEALLSGNVIRILVSEGVELWDVHYKCTNCGKEEDKIETGANRLSKHDCGGTMEVTSQTDAVEELIDTADKHNIDVNFISDETQYGKQLLMGFGGVAAMLRYNRQSG
jgi:peptide chain release factor subunit 1